MMWKSLGIALVALVAYANAACSDIDNCDSCTNPPLQCYTCGSGEVLNTAKTACLDCPANCDNCTADSDDAVTCKECATGYVLEEDGTCSDCGAGCTSCHYNDDDTPLLICDSCDIHYVQDAASKTGECVECGSYCKTCALEADGSTTCSVCYGVEEASKAYFLKASDKTCKSCPSNCVSCSDDGNGAGICKSCKDGYEVLEDPDDSTKDGTKCLKCPTDCSSCSGIDNSGSATCTACNDDEGLYVDDGECVYCDSDADEEACKTCDDEGECTECNEGWRLDSGSCTACPAFCLTCSVDEESGDDVCETCDSGYGTKLVSSVTCDPCPSNCDSCTIDSDGEATCASCKSGYAKNGDGKCTGCSSGCDSCSWQSSGSGWMKCTSCKTYYTDSPILPDDGAAESSSNIGVCKACPTGCSTCPDEDNCDACLTGYVLIVEDGDTICAQVTDNCFEAADNGTVNCDVCDDGYHQDADGECDPCPSSKNCKSCNTDGFDECDTCYDGYAFVDSDADNTTDSCEPCGISNCDTCSAIDDVAGATKKCFGCATGYVLYDTDDDTDNGYEQCKKCPTGCNTCTIDTSDNDKTKCTSSGCAAWDTKKAYAYDGDGGCEACPSNCESCTYDSSEETTICADGQCSDGYAKNDDSGECEECPDNCEQCEWDDESSSIICSSGGCETGYGLTLDSLCEACPNNCDECPYDETLEALICDTCSDGYRKNTDVCGACPSNCAECSDNSGSMVCSACKAGYALRSSDKVCVKCPSQCKECDAKATSVTCKVCNSGYGVSADKLSCVGCADAAFDNCATCGDVDAETEVAECKSCSSGYLLKDDASTCLDVSALDCPGGYEDKPAECQTCAAGFVTIPDLTVCTQYCYVCGDISKDSFVKQSVCEVSTNGSAKMERCDTGYCWAKYKDVDGEKMVVAGCQEPEDEACSGDVANGETCQTTENVEVCSRCCSGDKCNEYVAELDGLPDSAAVPAISAAVLALASLLAIYL